MGSPDEVSEVERTRQVDELIDGLLRLDYRGDRFLAPLRDQPEAIYIRALGRCGHPRAVPALLLVLEGGHAGVRHLAAEALGQIGDRSVLPNLVGQVGYGFSHATVRASARAMIALADLGSVPLLCEALLKLLVAGDTAEERALSRDVRNELVAKLGELGDARAVLPLLSWVEADGVPEALAQIGTPAIGELFHAIGPASEYDVATALEALVRLGASAQPALEAGLAHRSPILASRCAVALSMMGCLVPESALIAPALEDRRTAALAITAILRTLDNGGAIGLRAVIPMLRKVRRRWGGPRLLREAAGRALEILEARTGSRKDLPRPSEPGETARTQLPMPAREAANGTAPLPRPADPPS